MPVIVGNPDTAFLQLLAEVMERYHKPLHDSGTRVGVIMLADPDEGPAIVSKGHSVLARIKVCNLKERLKKGYDAELEVDENAYGELTEAQRIALLDHELSHIELHTYQYSQPHDAYGNPTGPQTITCKTDDLHRPKLRTVHGDMDVGDMFEAVIRRHGMDANEFRNIQTAYNRVRRANDDHLAELGKELIDNPRVQSRTLLDHMNDDEREMHRS